MREAARPVRARSEGRKPVKAPKRSHLIDNKALGSDEEWEKQRADLNALPYRGPELREEEHFFLCKVCGQAVDRRRLGDVLHHETNGHEPIPVS
jgi:hypothetical protein